MPKEIFHRGIVHMSLLMCPESGLLMSLVRCPSDQSSQLDENCLGDSLSRIHMYVISVHMSSHVPLSRRPYVPAEVSVGARYPISH